MKDNLDFAIIFENDVCFLSNFKDRLNLIAGEAKAQEGGFIISLENSTLKFPSGKRRRANTFIPLKKEGVQELI